MTLRFSVIETTMTPLWDYGWFDLTLFAVEGPPNERESATFVLGDFLRAAISQRSFCSPGPWGEPVQRHGPYIHGRLVTEWFRPVDPEELKSRVRRALDDPNFTEPPEAAQRTPVETWTDNITARGARLFALDAPRDTEVRVDWEYVWTVYQEFVAVSLNGQELSVAVIGYD